MSKKGDLTINAPVKKLFSFCGFTAQIGSITGKITLKGDVYYYVYTGKKRRARRADGSCAGWEIQLWLCKKPQSAYSSHIMTDFEPDYDWAKSWISCNSTEEGKRAQKIMATNPQMIWTPKYKEEGERNILAYVPKQKDLGFIYTMVRERQ